MAKQIVRPPSRAALRNQINDQRRQLFLAQAIVRVVRFAAASNLDGMEETDVTFALAAADKIIDDAAAALERVGGAT